MCRLCHRRPLNKEESRRCNTRCQTDYPVCRIRQRIAAFGSKSKSVTERCIDRSTFRLSGAFQSTPAGYGYTDQSIHPAEPQKLFSWLLLFLRYGAVQQTVQILARSAIRI